MTDEQKAAEAIDQERLAEIDARRAELSVESGKLAAERKKVWDRIIMRRRRAAA